VLTDNGIPFTDRPDKRSGPAAQYRLHVFDRVCRENSIIHKLTKPYHPWTNGQAERMNRTVKEATVRAFHYETLDSLKARLDAFITAYNFAKHLKSLRWRTPFQAICDAWTKDLTPFIINPHHLIPGPHTLVGDDRYSSIARLRAITSWGAPKVRSLAESSYFAGLRKAGIPEEER
jgi:hypothetical protein